MTRRDLQPTPRDPSSPSQDTPQEAASSLAQPGAATPLTANITLSQYQDYLFRLSKSFMIRQIPPHIQETLVTMSDKKRSKALAAKAQHAGPDALDGDAAMQDGTERHREEPTTLDQSIRAVRESQEQPIVARLETIGLDGTLQSEYRKAKLDWKLSPITDGWHQPSAHLDMMLQLKTTFRIGRDLESW